MTAVETIDAPFDPGDAAKRPELVATALRSGSRFLGGTDAPAIIANHLERLNARNRPEVTP